MAIKFKEEALPSVSTFGFDITRWAGVNTIKGSQYDYEMADCKNMCSDNYPYASPRKAREKLIDETDIKRIYKVEGGKVYFIDNEDCLCYVENGVKSYVVQKDSEENIKIPGCSCTNNYDKNTVFYPIIQHINFDNKISSTKHKFMFGETEGPYDVYGRYVVSSSYSYYYISSYGWKTAATFFVNNLAATKFKISVEFPKEVYPDKKDVTGAYIQEGKVNFPFHEDYSDAFLIRAERKNKDGVYKEHANIEWEYGVNEAKSSWDIEFTEFEEGDYVELYSSYSYKAEITENELNGKGYIPYFKAMFEFIRSGEWFVEQADGSYTGNPCDIPLDYGVVYNNRIIGVHKNQIRASALGDFTNFWEYADEAGNPSATGAYATDVGSAGDFTGICAYNNVLLLFKKDIVYEMYGSMPYTITELCSTGCIDNDSICSIDGVLYWASPKGIVRYSGGVPSVISTNIDIKTTGISKAGTDGRKYYVYDGEKIYVYDTYYKMWHIEDTKDVKMFYNQIKDLYMVCDDGIYKLNSGNENVEWEFTTKDYTFYSKERKTLSKLWIRAEMPQHSKLEIYVRQNGGEWTRTAVKTAERDEMFDFKLRVKKCDSYAIKFKGKGDVRILDIHGKVTVGTSKHRGGESLNVYRR